MAPCRPRSGSISPRRTGACRSRSRRPRRRSLVDAAAVSVAGERHLPHRAMMAAMDDERFSAKRDRLARMTRILALLNAHPDGMKPAEMARRVDSSVRTVYRDLRSIEGELS